MVLAALSRAGGEDYLLAQAHGNPRAFLALLGRIIPLQVTGRDGRDLIPDRESDPERVAEAVVLLLQARAQAKGAAPSAD